MVGGRGAHERGGSAVRAQHVVERTVGAQLAAGDDHDVVDALRDLGEQVARDEDRPPTPGLGPHEVTHPADAGRVEAVGRLVQDEHLGVAEQGGGDGEALAHAHRVTLHPPVGRVGEADLFEHVVDAFGRVVAGGRQHAQVVAPGAARVEAGVLEHGADVRARVRQLAVAPAGEGRRAAVAADQLEQHPQRGALAGAVRPQEAGDPARAHGEGHVGDGSHRAEALGEAGDLDSGSHGDDGTDGCCARHRAQGRTSRWSFRVRLRTSVAARGRRRTRGRRPARGPAARACAAATRRASSPSPR